MNIVSKEKKCKNLWLNTVDCTIANGGTNALRRIFKFQNLPLIQIKEKSYLKVNSITVSGAHNEMVGHNWIIKLHDVKYNQYNYYNSDRIQTPTIACFNYDSKNTVQNGLFSLEINPQDIVNLTLEIYNEEGVGLVKTTDVNLYINVIFEEFEEY